MQACKGVQTKAKDGYRKVTLVRLITRCGHADHQTMKNLDRPLMSYRRLPEAQSLVTENSIPQSKAMVYEIIILIVYIIFRTLLYR